MLDVLDDRAYGLVLLVPAVPNILPNPIPGLSGMLGGPLILVAGQLMVGRRHVRRLVLIGRGLQPSASRSSSNRRSLKSP